MTKMEAATISGGCFWCTEAIFKRRNTFLILTLLIILLGFTLRTLPVRNNNFYFTMDQGNDAVYVREILHRHQILLRGPETGLKGIYHGPGWYYFIAPGFLLFGGHPYGPVLMLTLLNLVLTATIIFKVARKVTPYAGLTTGAALQVFWPFYDTSRYAFNPFPTVFLSFLLIFALIKFLEGDKKYFAWAAIPIGLAFHCETAAGIGFFLFYLAIGVWTMLVKKLKVETFFAGVLIVFLFFIPQLISETKTNFSQTKALKREIQNPGGIFAQTQFRLISPKINQLKTTRFTPESNDLAILTLAVSFLLFLKLAKKNPFVSRFVYLSFVLTIISFLWFATNRGFQAWHTVYVKPLLFVTLLLMLFSLPRKIGLPIMILVLLSQVILFKQRYAQNFNITPDPSILANELAAVDWTYQKSEGRGFYVYAYLPSVYDYPYQYLFWWHGRQKYGFLPCEYSTYPNIPDFFVPGYKNYQQPQRECANLRFLIVEPDVRETLRNRWLSEATKNTTLVEKIQIGQIEVQKRTF